MTTDTSTTRADTAPGTLGSAPADHDSRATAEGEHGTSASPPGHRPTVPHLDPPLDRRRALGAWGEGLTARYLLDLGWEILARNWRCEHGEIDLLARDAHELVVVEVKTRTGVSFGEPVEQVTRSKAARLRRLAVAAAREFAPSPGPLRIDVVGVLWRPDGPAHVRHVRAVGS